MPFLPMRGGSAITVYTLQIVIAYPWQINVYLMKDFELVYHQSGGVGTSFNVEDMFYVKNNNSSTSNTTIKVLKDVKRTGNATFSTTAANTQWTIDFANYNQWYTWQCFI